jgi:hypothetical protein
MFYLLVFKLYHDCSSFAFVLFFFLQLTHCNLTLDPVLRFYISEIRRIFKNSRYSVSATKNFCYYCFWIFFGFPLCFFSEFLFLDGSMSPGLLSQGKWNIFKFFLLLFFFWDCYLLSRYSLAIPNVHPSLGRCFYF